MIELDKLLQLAKNMGVSLDVMIMEAYQILLLNDIGESVISKNLILKGGTCLRLGYQAWRFSEDLDFSWLKKIEFSKFKQVITATAKRYPEVIINDIYDMKKTLFARLVVQIGKKVGVSKKLMLDRVRFLLPKSKRFILNEFECES